MFLKIATVIAIVGVALSLFLSFIQQAMYSAGMYGEGFVMLARLMAVLDLVLLHGGLLVFLVAFVFNLRSKMT